MKELTCQSCKHGGGMCTHPDTHPIQTYMESEGGKVWADACDKHTPIVAENPVQQSTGPEHMTVIGRETTKPFDSQLSQLMAEGFQPMDTNAVVLDGDIVLIKTLVRL